MATRDSGGGQAQRGKSEQTEEVTEAQDSTDLQERHEKLTDDVESMLDEIDEVLEENAEEFVRSFVQKGGQ
jgi:ubiquitin-like protein Pup